jgi:hypothetical protein
MLNLVASRLFFKFVARHLEVDDLIRVVDWWMFTKSWAIMVIPPKRVIFDQWLLIIRLPGLFLSLGEATFDLFITLLRSPEDMLLWLKTAFFDLWQGTSPARFHEKRKATRRRDVPLLTATKPAPFETTSDFGRRCSLPLSWLRKDQERRGQQHVKGRRLARWLKQ